MMQKSCPLKKFLHRTRTASSSKWALALGTASQSSPVLHDAQAVRTACSALYIMYKNVHIQHANVHVCLIQMLHNYIPHLLYSVKISAHIHVHTCTCIFIYLLSKGLAQSAAKGRGDGFAFVTATVEQDIC